MKDVKIKWKVNFQLSIRASQSLDMNGEDLFVFGGFDQNSQIYNQLYRINISKDL